MFPSMKILSWKGLWVILGIGWMMMVVHMDGVTGEGFSFPNWEGRRSRLYPEYGPLACNGGLERRLGTGTGSIRWVDWTRYVGRKGVAPGKVVKIRCGDAVVVTKGMDIHVGGLEVDGLLWFKGGRGTNVKIRVGYVVVQGVLLVGNPHSGYRGSLTFSMKPSGEHVVFRPDGAVEGVGRSAFAVVGGRVELYGMPGGASCVQHSWTKLKKTVRPRDRTIQVPTNVAQCWNPGHEVVISSGDGVWSHAEQRKIVRISQKGSTSTITLDRPLVYGHPGLNEKVVSRGRVIRMASEVALLTRNVRIVGENIDRYLSGHFIITSTPRKHVVEGVEFVNLGQQGVLGRYACHFHLCRYARGSRVRGISVHHTKQRGLVIHGTNELLVEYNVFYLVTGHTIFLEDGSEIGNKIIGNVMIATKNATKQINKDGVLESDNAVSSVWISNPDNLITKNVIGGSEHYGYWIEILDEVRAPSNLFPEARGVKPGRIPLRKFFNNEAHSVKVNAFNTFVNGYQPPETAVIEDFFAWRSGRGVYYAFSANIVIRNSVFVSDAGQFAVYWDRTRNCEIHDSLIIGRTDIIGGNIISDDPNLNGDWCGTETALQLHPTEPKGLQGGGYRFVNVTFDKFRNCPRVDGRRPIEIRGSKFDKKFNAFMTSSTVVEGIRFLDIDDGYRMTPYYPKVLNRWWVSHIVICTRSPRAGSNGEFLVWPEQALLPPRKIRCSYRANEVNYLCKNICYRTIGIEVQISASLASSISVRLRRQSDGATYVMASNHKSASGRVPFFANLIAGERYKVEYLLRGSPYQPTKAYVSLDDGAFPSCAGAIQLEFPQTSSSQTTFSGKSIRYNCRGGSVSSSKLPLTGSGCSSSSSHVRFLVLPPSASAHVVTVSKVNSPRSLGSCGGPNSCKLPSNWKSVKVSKSRF